MEDGIGPAEFHASEGTEDWRAVGDGCQAFFRTSSLAESARFVEAIGGLDGTGPFRPDVDIRAGGVTVRLLTYTEEWYGPSRRDVELARRISGIARNLGLGADPSQVQSSLLVVETLDIPKVMPFWQALYGYERRKDSVDEDLVDPRGRDIPIWFEQTDALRPERNTIHVAVWVPEEEAEARVAACLAAGGRLVTDRFAPSWWVLADPEGNEADVASTAHRG